MANVGGAGGTSVAGATSAAGAGGLASCVVGGTPGPFNQAGALGLTRTFTDWSWSAPSDSVEAELRIETDLSKDGYFWAYQFGFVGGIGGFFGLQRRGGYQADPPDGPVEVAEMAVFWVGGSPLRAELGDIQYPNARAYLEQKMGSGWWTLHARYEWSICQNYRLRVARQSTEATGDIWYGATVRDEVTGVDTFIGRVLVPAAWGQLSTAGSTWIDRIGRGTLTTCNDIEYSSGTFLTPSAANGTLSPTSHSNRFEMPGSCPNARFTELPEGVRHEVGVPR